MSTVILKFGGSSLTSRSDLSRILRVVESYNRPFIAVVSAASGVTNRIISALCNIQELNVDSFLKELYLTYKGLIGTDHEGLRDRVYQIKEMLMGAKLIGEAPDFIFDHIVSHGERCSSFATTCFFQEHGLECEEALPEDFGLVAKGRFGNATIDLKASERNLKSYFKADKSYVVPGFYAIDEGRIKLLGRGGSDYSATSIAYCLDAEHVALYKDVSGFMTCDPKHVANVKPVRDLNYDEAAELSYFGAKILHHAAVDPVRKKNIPLYIYNINSFSSIDNPDTVISTNSSSDGADIRSISFTDDISVIQFKGTNVGRVPGLLGQIASSFGSHGINIKSVVTSQTSINVLISRQDVPRCRKITDKMSISEVEYIRYKTDISLIAAVSDKLLKTHGIAARMFSAVSEEHINVEMISAGASEVTIYFIVKLRDRDRALKAIYREFFGGDPSENH